MTLQEKLDKKKTEYDAVVKQIAGLEAGPVRVELKRRANGLSGDIVRLRALLIQAELAKENPQNVPRVDLKR